jgi:hypothetical protein
VLNCYEAWNRETLLKNGQWKETLLGPDNVRRMRADVWQNLYYYRGVERVRGHVEDRGPATALGVACEQIVFSYDGVPPYTRFFDRATGRLVMSSADSSSTVEEGEVMAGGIRFPHGMTMTQTTADGQTIKQEIVFDKIVVNETFPADLFDMPLATPK